MQALVIVQFVFKLKNLHTKLNYGKPQ